MFRLSPCFALPETLLSGLRALSYLEQNPPSQQDEDFYADCREDRAQCCQHLCNPLLESAVGGRKRASKAELAPSQCARTLSLCTQ